MTPSPAAPFVEPIHLRVLNRLVAIEPGHDDVRECLVRNFDVMIVPDADAKADLFFSVRRTGESFVVSRPDGAPVSASSLGDVVYRVEKALTIALQKRRPDLLFLHAAVVEWEGKAVILAGDTGAGKSTTTWALLHHGFGYLSDELGPIDLENLQVLAYPHALCLKQRPSAPYALSPSAMYLGRTIHTPAASLPKVLADESLPLGAVFLLRHDPDLSAPAVCRLGAAEASARIYLTTLNALAHPDRGITAVLRIAESAPCFALATADLYQTSLLIRSTIERDTTCLSSSC